MTQEAFDPSKHIPVTTELPDEAAGQMSDRADIPPPSPYARGAVVTSRRPNEEGVRVRAVVHRVDFVTRQIRLWYPAENKFDERTIWRSFDDWEPEITLAPDEVERREAKKQIEAEIADLVSDDLELILALVDKNADARDQLTKIRALKKRFVVTKKGGK